MQLRDESMNPCNLSSNREFAVAFNSQVQKVLGMRHTGSFISAAK